MGPAELDSLVEYYLPVLVTAGGFALAIQSRVGRPAQKAGADAWASAVTDADLAVQSFVEIATLARDSRLGFDGEESARSANRRYFDAHAESVIHLDPINGTYLYQQQHDGWDIILSVSHRGRLLATVSYMPARGLFYVGRRGRGALSGNRDEPRLSAMQPLRTQSGSRVCLTYQADDVLAAISDRYAATDLVANHRPGKSVDNLNDLFTGRLDAFACRGGELLDWGALACIVIEAGGAASRLDGSPLTELDEFLPDRRADLLLAASPAIHREILGLIAAWPGRR